jgi:MAGUK p55 subfamily protein 5
MLNDLKTCLTLLRRTEIQSLLNVFDNVLKLHGYPSALPENEDTIVINNPENETIESNEELLKLSQYAIDQLKIVKIEKNHQPLGLTISRTDSGTIHIARIVVGGLAASTQLFQVNDRILEINDQSITDHSLDYVCTLMSNTTGLIKFLLAPPINLNKISYETFHVRALYAYNPFNDPLLPCKELGLTFQRGDILRIVAREENLIKMNNSYMSWWQAYRENFIETETDSCLAGLIPSDSLQQKRTDLLKAVSDDTDSISSSSSSGLFNGKKKINKTCFTCVNSKQERKSLQTIYNNASFIRDINDKETPTIRTSTNHFSLTDTRQLDAEQPSTTLKRFSDKDNDTTIDSFRFYEMVFQLDLSTQQMTRPIVLIGMSSLAVSVLCTSISVWLRV